ncbi:MAG: hypothetical protein J6K29_05960 [Clostridia bacterium]|nr:hypothetical protein [Clostridia bacterium]
MFKIIIGVVFTIAIVVGACILCVRLEKKASEEAAQKKQMVERERSARVKRILNNPAFQKMMDHCVRIFFDDLLFCEQRRDSVFWVRIYVYGNRIEVHHSYKNREITFRQYDMENIKELDILFAFMESAKQYLPQKIITELENRGFHNCTCTVTWERKTERDLGNDDKWHEYTFNKIDVTCKFIYELNQW